MRGLRLEGPESVERVTGSVVVGRSRDEGAPPARRVERTRGTPPDPVHPRSDDGPVLAGFAGGDRAIEWSG